MRSALHTLCTPFLAYLALIPSGTAESLNLPALLKNGSARVETESGDVLLSHRDQELFVPASTLKIATAFCALEELGPTFTFTTSFFSDGTSTLYIKGSGDPTLVSEELSVIAKSLAPHFKRLDKIVIDGSLFDDDLVIDGVSHSTNPYDSKNAAFVGNFSTAFVSRRRDGSVVSAEPQTPLTPLSKSFGLTLKRGASERINLGRDWRTGTRYGGELLGEFLEREGVLGAKQVSLGTVPSTARPLYNHRSTQPLSSVVQGLLKYSTNFTANQIFLMLGVQKFGSPATVAKGQKALRECLERRAGWRGFSVEEGSGLSRRNAVSARHMTQLLKHFERYRELLDTQEHFQAKTGSLNGVNSLAGYFETPNSGRVRFAILINSPVPHTYKFTVAKKLRDELLRRGK